MKFDTRHIFITLACLVVLIPFCLVYYFSVCGEVGCGGRPVLAHMHIAIWLIVLLVNILFARRKNRHENPHLAKSLKQIPPLPGQDTPKTNGPGYIGATLGVVIAAYCGLTVGMILRKWYCLDELCSNLEDGGQWIDSATVVVIASVAMLILGVSEYRRNRR